MILLSTSLILALTSCTTTKTRSQDRQGYIKTSPPEIISNGPISKTSDSFEPFPDRIYLRYVTEDYKLVDEPRPLSGTQMGRIKHLYVDTTHRTVDGILVKFGARSIHGDCECFYLGLIPEKYAGQGTFYVEKVSYNLPPDTGPPQRFEIIGTVDKYQLEDIVVKNVKNELFSMYMDGYFDGLRDRIITLKSRYKQFSGCEWLFILPDFPETGAGIFEAMATLQPNTCSYK